MLKRFASPLIKTSDNQYLSVRTVEIQNGCFVRSYPVEAEEAATIWLDGMIEIVGEGEYAAAYLLSPYDCVNRQPVDETRRIQLK
jgi:hypothetical protein